MILVIDDDPGFRYGMIEMLRNAGWQAEGTPMAEDGLKILQRRKDVDLVLLDLRMPGMGGMAFLEKYRQVSPLTDVVVVTGYADYDTAVRSLSGGASAPAVRYLEKPCPPQQVLQLAEEMALLDVGPFRLNRRTHIVYYTPKGVTLPLDPQQFKLFLFFAKNPEQYFSYLELGQAVMEYKFSDSNDAMTAMKTHIHRIRSSIGAATGEDGFLWLRTQRNVGIGFFPHSIRDTPPAKNK